jgi:spermidine dehydrogenase
MFPDGNSSIARLLVRSLVPRAVPGMTASTDPFGIVTARVVYEELDREDSPVRIRLNSTAVHVENVEEGVTVSYAQGRRLLRVRGRQCVLACYNRMIPYLCPSLPEPQKQALAQCIKRPMLIINVMLRYGEAIKRRGIAGAVMPARLCQSMMLVTGINAADYHPKWRPEDPCVIQFYAGVSAPEPDGLTLIERNEAGRVRLLAMSFADFEREVRTVLDAIYGPSEFHAANDISAIMVNRWPHGYARDHIDLEDPAWNADPPPNVVGRARFGNIAIANSDAGADAFTHTAIDQAWRAVNELQADA